MKGIILSGGFGTRLHPLTLVTSKQLLPIYDKPMVYYPLCNLMQAGIRKILLITSKDALHQYKSLLKDGSQWGIEIDFIIQDHPNGIAEAFLLGENFLGDESCALILGDNLFYGENLPHIIRKAIKRKTGATIFAYEVEDPERFGVISFNSKKQIESIEEKPKIPKSNYAVPGLYFYDHRVVEFAKNLRPSKRGELEIQDINQQYLDKGELFVEFCDDSVDWIDAGTFTSLLNASSYVRGIEEKLGLKISCPEEYAWRNGWISDDNLASHAETLSSNSYGAYLYRILQKKYDVSSATDFDELIK